MSILNSNSPAGLAATSVVEAFKTGVMVNGLVKRSDSLISYTKECRIEPITLVEDKLTYLPYLGDILQTANSMFAGYYLQAISMDAVVGGCSVLKRLDKFNPERSPYLHTLESYNIGLPKFGLEANINSMLGMPPDPKDSIKSIKDAKEKSQEFFLKEKNEKEHIQGHNRETLVNIKEANNIAVGKLLEVELKHEDKTLKLPVAVRLNIKTIDNPSLLHILSLGKDNKSAKERYHGWRSGELQFWRDIVFAEDLIKAHRNTLAKDKSGVYAELMRKKNNNILAMALSKDLSVGTASNIIVISDKTRKELEFNVGGKLSDFNVRSKIFSETYMMLMFVVDAEYEHVTIYHRGLNMSTDMSLKEIKVANKNDSSMITDVLKAFVSGHAPTF